MVLPSVLQSAPKCAIYNDVAAAQKAAIDTNTRNGTLDWSLANKKGVSADHHVIEAHGDLYLQKLTKEFSTPIQLIQWKMLGVLYRGTESRP